MDSPSNEDIFFKNSSQNEDNLPTGKSIWSKRVKNKKNKLIKMNIKYIIKLGRRSTKKNSKYNRSK
jgi:hypothetical protein